MGTAFLVIVAIVLMLCVLEVVGNIGIFVLSAVNWLWELVTKGTKK